MRRLSNTSRVRTGLVLLSMLVLTGCQPASVLNFLTPKADFTLEKNLSYGSDPRHLLDVYTPQDITPRQPIIVFVHGGSWATGSKDDYLFVGQAFAKLGYVAVVPNYRLYPQVEFPAFVEDIALAIASLDQILPAASCPDTQKIILAGHSAGGHIVAMLATNPKYLQQQGAEVKLQALIGLAGPYDLPLEHPLVIDKFTSVTDNLEANPINLATTSTPPSLLLHGEKDTTVFPYHTHDFTERLQQLGVPVEKHLYPDTDHIKLLGALSTTLRFLNPAQQDISNYLQKNGLNQPCK